MLLSIVFSAIAVSCRELSFMELNPLQENPFRKVAARLPKKENVLDRAIRVIKQTPKSNVKAFSPFKPNEAFDICYINLEKESKRNEHIKELLDAANCSYTRFNGVNGISLLKKEKSIEDYSVGLKIDVDLAKYSCFPERTFGMIGCKLSHFINLKRIESLNSEKPVLIAEDDIDFECNFVEKVESALKEIPNDWDILLITEFYRELENDNSPKMENLVKVGYFFECLGFLVNGSRAAKKIADLIEFKCNANAPVDLFLAYEAIAKRLNVYALRDKMAIQMRREFPSSIATSQVIHSKPLKNSLNDFVNKNKGLNN